MFYYYEPLQTKSGDILPDYLVRLLDAGGNEVDIFADNSGTPIITVSGVANAAKADDLGMVRFWVPNGTYDIAIYDTTDTFKGREEGVPMMDAGGVYTDLSEDTGASLVGSTGGLTVQASLNARPTSATLADTGGAAAVGTTNSDVQTDIDSLYETASSLLDLSTLISVTGTTALDADDLNKTIIVSGSSSFTLNLPPASAVGQALKLVAARSYTGVATVQAAAGSGLTIDGQSAIYMMAGESATAVYDGTAWVLLDRVRNPIIAEMANSGATSLSSSFTQVPFPTAGTQFMLADLKALWDYSGGYFTAPRAGVFQLQIDVWLNHSGSGQYDVGAYAGSATGSSPPAQSYGRFSVDSETYRKITFIGLFPMSVGQKLYPSIRALTVTSPTVVASTTLSSRIRVTEQLAR